MTGDITTLAEVRDRVEVMSRDCFDVPLPVKELQFESLDHVFVGSSRYKLREMAQREFACRLGVPMPYLRKCPEDVQAYNLNHWLAKERNEELYLRFDSDEIRAVFTPRYVPVDNIEILEGLNSLGFAPDTEVQCRMDQEFMLLGIPDTDNGFSVQGDDRMLSGFSLGNSEVGVHALTISCFILRLVCTNGLIGTEEAGVSFRHVSRRIRDELPGVMDKVRQGTEVQRHRIGVSLESQVDNPEHTFKMLNSRFQLTPAEAEAVSWAWPSEMGPTMFNIVNAYTRAAQYQELTAESAYRLQKIAGKILALVN